MKLDILNNVRINRIVRNLQDELELAKPLTFLNRVPMADVFDNSEILATYTAKIYAADIIMDDSEARIVETGAMDFAAGTNVVPNIKLGRSLTQAQLTRLNYLRQGLANVGGDVKDMIVRQEIQMARELVQGVRETMNLLCASMFLDGVTYDRFGLKIAAGFRTPANLKVSLVGGRQWTQANLATMDAITDLQQVNVTAQQQYGRTYNTVDMPLALFQLIIQSDAFKNQIRVYRGMLPTEPVDISIYNLNQAQQLFTLISGFNLNLEDKSIVFKNANGTDTSQRVLPANKVLLSNSADFGNDQVWDFAQGLPDEVTVSRLIANTPDVGIENPGIAAFYAPNTLTLNPPGITAWAVVKGFPRKHDIHANGVLTVF